MAKLEGRPVGSTRNSPTFQPLPSLGVAKGQQAAPTSPKPLILPTISSSPPPNSDQIHNRPWPAVYKSALSDKNPFVTYSAPTSGASVDLWKKVAKKAELELHLERNNHRADCSRDHHIIHRLSRRMIPMEKALEKSKATVKQQVKLIEDLKSKMLSASEKTEAEVSYLRHQNDKMQRFLSVAAENRTGKITELEEELRQANSSVAVLKEHMDQIHNIVNDLPAGVKKYSSGESEKSGSGPTDRDSVVLGIVKGICHKNEQLEKQLRDTDEKLHLVARENERVRKAAEEAAGRNKELVKLVASLTEERDMALIQLKETEDIVGSINDLEDIVRSCTSPPDCESPSVAQNRRTPPQHDAVSLRSEFTLKQTLRWPVVNSKHLSPPTEEENPVPLFPAEAEDPTDLSAMRAGPSKTVVYCGNMSGEDIRTIGVALVAKLHAAFRLLSSKRESAKQCTASLRKQNEALRSTMQEAYDGLTAGKIPESRTPVDYGVALLVAVQEGDQFTEGLRKEKAVLEALKLEHEKTIHDLESQTHNLTLDKKVLLGTIEVVKNVMRASTGGEKQLSYLGGFPNRTKVQDESLTELQERDSLDTQLQDLKENCQFLLQEKELFVQSLARCKLLKEEKDVLERDLEELRKGYQNLKADFSSKEDSLKVRENYLVEMRAHIDTTVDRSAWSDTLKELKCTLEAANAGGKSSDVGVTPDDEKEFSGLLVTARQLVEEINEARSTGETLKEQTELKEKELSEVRERFHESISLCVQLQSDIDALEFAMQDLHKSIQCIKKVLDEGIISTDSEEVENRKIFWKADGLVHEKVVNEVSSILQKLNAAQRSFNEIEEAVGVKVLPGTDLQAKAANILTFLKSVKEDRELAYFKLRDLNELLPGLKEHLKCMLDLLADTDSNSSLIAEEDKEYRGTSSKDEALNFKEVMKSASDLSEVIKLLPSLTEKIRKLKTGNDTLSVNLQALEFEKLAITHTSIEDQEKLQRLRKNSQREINHLKQQLNAVECLLASASSNSIEYRLNNSPEGKRGGRIEQTPLLKELVAMRDELCVLRREKPSAGVKAGELALQLVSEQEKVKDVTRVLLMTETRTKSLTNRAIAAEASVQDLTTQIEILEKDLTGSKAELGALEEKLYVQEELFKIDKSKWTTLVEEQRAEILRLGGSHMRDPREKMRRADAAEAVKHVLSKYPQTSSLRPSKGGYRISPLAFLTTFTVDLLVNGKIFNQLEVGGSTGGLSHGVIHYFSVSAQTGDITFGDPMMPGSLSSNMVADVSLIPKEDQKLYRTEPGDVLGLQIRVASIEDPTPKEALYNTSIVRTNQVLDAIKGRMVDTFTLWPDIVSCWRWERGKTKENSWNLTGVRWRFFMKNIFPDLSESLQALAIPESASRPRVSTIVAI